MTEWHSIKDNPPPIGRKFIALFSDGSGSGMFFRHDDGFIDCEGDESSTLGNEYDVWTDLPQDMEFCCETRSEDPMTLTIG